MKRCLVLLIALTTIALLSSAILAAGRSDVADAAMKGDKAAVRTLIQQKADVNAPQADGATALHWAAYRGDKELADMLIKAGASARVANREGSTPLWLASINGDSAMIAALIGAGADPNEHLPLGRNPLMAAARTGNVDAIKTLIDFGANVNVNQTDHGIAALLSAADEGDGPAVQLVIQRVGEIGARSDPAPRGRGLALGKAPDPRKAVGPQRAALAAREASPDLGALR